MRARMNKCLYALLLLLQQLEALATALASSAPVAAGRTSRASPARTEPPGPGCLAVGTSQPYANLSAALGALGAGANSSEPACIFLYPGTYHEQVVIDYRGSLDMYGWTTDVSTYANNTVTVTYDQGAVEGAPYAGASVTVLTPNFRAYNIDWANGHGPGIQGLAMYAAGERMGFYGCGFFGYQDTLYAGYNYQYYKKCYIEGAVDFIYGWASAWFSECDIRVTDSGYITANGRYENDTSWYVIDSSTVRAADGVDAEAYLGRPWGVLARVMYQNSELGSVVQPAGWTTMTEGAVPTFEEFGNRGPGANTSARVYETVATRPVTMDELWPDGYDWIDAIY